MGNRSFLYLTTSDDSDNPLEIAEASNNFPTLWQLLLATGDASQAIDRQRVFGDAGSENLAANADDALERLRTLAEFLRGHPRRREQPLLDLQFAALLAHLQESVEQLRESEGSAVLFSADLDELSWMGSEEPDEFIQQCRRDCNALWEQVQSAIRHGHHALVDEALALNQGGGFESWGAWAWNFGFAGLHHAYFNQCDEPRAVPFADFRPAPREWEDHFGDGFARFERNGLWGVRWQDGEDSGVHEVLAPEWDRITHADYGAVWVLRDGLYGYARLQQEGMQVQLPPQLDDVDTFSGDAGESDPNCAIVGRNGRYGMLRADGSWLFEPSVDAIWRFDFGYAPFRQGEHEGFIDREGRIAIPAEFDSVSAFAPCGLAPVWCGEQAGLVRGDGQMVLAPSYDELSWSEECRGFVATIGDKVGLLNADGSVWIAAQYDEVEVLFTRIMFKVRLGPLWGVCDWSGRERIAPRYPKVGLLYRNDVDFDNEEIFTLLRREIWSEFVLVHEQQQVGVVDLDNRVRVPIAYNDVEAFDTFYDHGAPVKLPSLLFRVVRQAGKRRQLQGVYDVEHAREIVAPEWDRILLTAFAADEAGFLVSRAASGRRRKTQDEELLGLLRRDGSVLFAPEYVWLGARWSLSGPPTVDHLIRAELYEAWRENRPLQALRGADRQFVWLHRDGRIESHLDYLTRRHEEAGDLEAALQLGRDLRDGRGIPEDRKLARHWLWLATGAETVVEAAPPIWCMIFGKWLDGPTADGTISDPAPSRRPRSYRAMHELALLLCDTDDFGEQPATARKWLEFALTHGGQDDGSVLADLAYMHECGIGGKTDRKRAKALYEMAIERGSTTALHNLALAYQFGRGIAPDLDLALDYFRRAVRLGDASCAYHAGAVLIDQAAALSGRARQEKLSEAIYELSTLIDRDIEHSNAACARYAQICLDPGSREYNPAEAERLLLRGAEADDPDCMNLLIDALYGKPDSELANPEQAAYWADRKAGLEADE